MAFVINRLRAVRTPERAATIAANLSDTKCDRMQVAIFIDYTTRPYYMRKVPLMRGAF